MTIPRLRGEGFLESQLRQLSYFCLISGKLKLNSPTPLGVNLFQYKTFYSIGDDFYKNEFLGRNIEPIQNEVDPPHFVWPYFCLRAGFSTQ